MRRADRPCPSHANYEGNRGMTEDEWQRSSFCGGGGNNCVEVAATTHGVALRESDSPAEVIATERGALRALVLGVRAGELTPPRV